MPTTTEMRRKAAKLKEEAKAILAQATAEGRDLNTEEVDDFDERVAQAETLMKEANARDGLAYLDERSHRVLPRKTSSPGNVDGLTPQNMIDEEPDAQVWIDKAGSVVEQYAGGERMAGRLSVNPAEVVRGFLTGKDMQLQMGHNTGIASAGGYLTMTGQAANFWIDAARDQSRAMQLGVLTVPVEGSSLDIMKVTADPTVTWTGELASIAESEPTFGRVRLEPRKAALRLTVSNEQIEDSVNSAAMIQQVIGSAMANEWDRVIFRGSGGGQEPTGIMNYSGVLTAGAPSDYDDFIDAIAQLEAVNAEPRSALMAVNVKQTLSKLKESATAQYLAPPAAYTDLQRVTSSKLADSTSIVGDFREAIVGVRRELTINVNRGGTTARQDAIELIATIRMDVALARPNHFVVMSA